VEEKEAKVGGVGGLAEELEETTGLILFEDEIPVIPPPLPMEEERLPPPLPPPPPPPPGGVGRTPKEAR